MGKHTERWQNRERKQKTKRAVIKKSGMGLFLIQEIQYNRAHGTKGKTPS